MWVWGDKKLAKSIHDSIPCRPNNKRSVDYRSRRKPRASQNQQTNYILGLQDIPPHMASRVSQNVQKCEFIYYNSHTAVSIPKTKSKKFSRVLRHFWGAATKVSIQKWPKNAFLPSSAPASSSFNSNLRAELELISNYPHHPPNHPPTHQPPKK